MSLKAVGVILLVAGVVIRVHRSAIRRDSRGLKGGATTAVTTSVKHGSRYVDSRQMGVRLLIYASEGR